MTRCFGLRDSVLRRWIEQRGPGAGLRELRDRRLGDGRSFAHQPAAGGRDDSHRGAAARCRLIHHSDRGVHGGFDWSSQHPSEEL